MAAIFRKNTGDEPEGVVESESFELDDTVLDAIAGGKQYTTDPDDPDFDTFMLVGEEAWIYRYGRR